MAKNIVPVLVALALFLLLLFVPRGPSHGSADTREDLARRAFEALKADDFALMESTVLSAADLEAIIENAQDGAEPARRRTERRGGAPALAARAMKRVRGSFEEARRKGTKDFDWAVAKFGGLDPEHSATERTGGIEEGDVEFLVEAEDKRVPVRLQQVIRVRDAWVVVGGFLYRPIQQGTPEYAAVKMLEGIAEAVKMHLAIHKELPASLDVLRQEEGHIGEPLLRNDPVDPWGRPIVYRPGHSGLFIVATNGPDGLPNTDDDIKFAPR